MIATHVIKTRVSPNMKARVLDEAQRELLTESLWLRSVVEAALSGARRPGDRRHRTADVRFPGASVHSGEPRDGSGASRTRVYIRIRHDDRMVLRERAEARGMPAATYAAAVLRAHLRALAPLPREELTALKRSIAELGAIGRNLNQIARVALQSGRITGPSRDDLRTMLKICEAMREHVKSLVRANVASWESGYAEAGS